MQGKQQKGQFLHKTGNERAKAISEIQKKIKDGLFSSEKVIQSIVNKLEPHFTSSIEEILPFTLYIIVIFE